MVSFYHWSDMKIMWVLYELKVILLLRFMEYLAPNMNKDDLDEIVNGFFLSLE